MPDWAAWSGLAGAAREAFGQFRKMPSLSQILRDHSPLLLIDASSGNIQVGLLGKSKYRWASRVQDAGVGVFECIDELEADLDSVGSFAFCEGPGSILGIRTSAMALRIWNELKPRPMFAYVGLAVVAQAVARPAAVLIADARRGLWHRITMGGKLERVPASELSGELMTPDGFRHWEPLPPGTSTTGYDLAKIFSMPEVSDADLFREAPAPDAFLHREPEYARWTPQIHRAP
jgi:tRNA threonylcarbamoyladenosine biosynthesis protein TsaB